MGPDARGLTDVVARLRRALRRSIRSDYPWEARPMAQVEVLQTLHDAGPIRIGDLAVRLNLAQSTVSTLVGRLLSDGLVERGVDRQDRRAAVLSLSPAGVADLAAWDDAHQQRLGRALATLRTDEQRRIAAALPALGRLVEALEAEVLMIRLRSKALAEAGYDPQTRVLRVRFRESGAYEYLDVPPDVWAGLSTSAHPWTEWGSYIKENFEVRPVA